LALFRTGSSNIGPSRPTVLEKAVPIWTFLGPISDLLGRPCRTGRSNIRPAPGDRARKSSPNLDLLRSNIGPARADHAGKAAPIWTFLAPNRTCSANMAPKQSQFGTVQSQNGTVSRKQSQIGPSHSNCPDCHLQHSTCSQVPARHSQGTQFDENGHQKCG
jgi:hypothetical protein